MTRILQDLSPCPPEDEYDPEVGDILLGLRSCNNEKEVALMLVDVLKKWFSDDISIDDSVRELLGKRLHQLKNRYNLFFGNH